MGQQSTLRQASIQARAFAGATGWQLNDREQYQLFRGGAMKSNFTEALMAGIAPAILRNNSPLADRVRRTGSRESVRGIIMTPLGGESDG